jgi:hypothetical protein
MCKLLNLGFIDWAIGLQNQDSDLEVEGDRNLTCPANQGD